MTSPEIKEADRLARAAADACQPEGRALFAGHASLPWPGEPHLDLWHSLTLLREHRGDGHLIALQVAGYSGCDAMVTTQAMGDAPAAFVATRAWSAEQWAELADGLRARGLIDGDGVVTEAGARTAGKSSGRPTCSRWRPLRRWARRAACACASWSGR